MLVLVFLLALVIRVLFVWIQGSFHVFDMYFVASDTRVYEALAYSLLSDGSYALDGMPTALVTPGYPLFLTGLHGLGMKSPQAVGFVQGLLGAATCVLVAMVGPYLGDARVGAIAGLLSSFYPHLIFWTGYVLTDTLFVFFAVASLAALLWWQEDVTAQLPAGVAGVLLGAGSLTRPHLVGFAVLGVILIILRSRLKRRALCSGMLLILALTAVLAPWAIRNYRVFGVPIVGSTLTGEVLYQGNSFGATGGTGGYVHALDFQRLQLPPGLSEVEVNRAYSRAAWDFILHQPGMFPPLALKKFVNMWRPTYAGASRRNLLIFGGSYLLVVALSLIGISRIWRIRLGKGATLLLACLAYFVILHLVIPGMIRYRLPAEPVLIVFAAMGLLSVFDAVRRAGFSAQT